jgi:hypothetical protein
MVGTVFNKLNLLFILQIFLGLSMRIQHFGDKKTQKNKNGWLFCLILISLNIAASGCALSERRVHPEFATRIHTVAQPVLIPPDVGMLELLPSGLIRQRDDWSAAGCRNLQNAISTYLKNAKITLKPLIINPHIAPEIAEIQALYRLVHKSMQQQTFNAHQDSQARRSWEYSVGPINALLNKLGADSMIFVSGYDRVSNAGRKALIDIAIADASGTILYYAVQGTTRGRDLRDPASANIMVHELLSGFSRIKG